MLFSPSVYVDYTHRSPTVEQFIRSYSFFFQDNWIKEISPSSPDMHFISHIQMIYKHFESDPIETRNWKVKKYVKLEWSRRNILLLITQSPCNPSVYVKFIFIRLILYWKITIFRIYCCKFKRCQRNMQCYTCLC